MKIFRSILLLAASAAFLSSCSYNTLVEQRETIDEKWAQVETQYQRRSDLIPNLVSTVEGYADFEKSTLLGVTQARSQAATVKLDPKDLTPENIEKFQAAQDKLGQSVRSFINVVFEKYPDLKANQNFMELQAELEGTENRITIARENFNTAVKEYNTKVSKFPSNITASMFGFDKRGYFKAEAGSEKAPKVNFKHS